ncbi:hypothetical protein SRHO_G00220730 [Serrasalmus rhombeus]
MPFCRKCDSYFAVYIVPVHIPRIFIFSCDNYMIRRTMTDVEMHNWHFAHRSAVNVFHKLDMKMLKLLLYAVQLMWKKRQCSLCPNALC